MQLLFQSDSSKGEQKEGERLLREIFDKLAPIVQRLDSTVMRKDLQFLQQAVIHVRQTKIQLKLYQAYKRYAEKRELRFLEQYQTLFPVNNHPGCLLLQKEKQKKEKAKSNRRSPDKALPRGHDSDEVEDALESSEETFWWEKVFSKHTNMGDVVNGNKIVLLIKILVLADRVNDKVVVFSQNLHTLDFIEKVLQRSDWSGHVPGLKNLSPDKTLGNWKKI